MAHVKKHFWGFEVFLNHGEACAWTGAVGNVQTVTGVATALGKVIAATWFAPLAGAVAAVIIAASAYIRELNTKSGGKGVRLKFMWPATYIGVSRRDRGASPCT